MDQSVVAGIGNVYRAEALFVAGIHPLRQGSQLDDGELEVLWEIVSGMLRAGRRTGRIVTVDRAEIGLAPRARIPREEATYVYKRDRCVRCGNVIRMIEIAGRTCYYCPTDQPA
jgi:endonuclease-8